MSQIEIEKFEMDWSNAKKYLLNMMNNKSVGPEWHRELNTRIRSMESLVISISDSVRSDKD
jgi:hypothetical protein